MERLTEKHYGTDGYFMKCSEACANDDEMCGGCPELDKIIDRLGAYEDTGLTPEQVAALKERKPIEAFLHPIDAYEGLKEKYLVFKADTGEKVRNCFVLRPDKDPAAIVALRAYAETTDNENLAGDIYIWVGKDNNVPSKWIPVSERLPEPETEVLVLAERKCYSFKAKGVTTFHIVTNGMYEDGTKNTEDSNWCWETDGFEYDEELDAYIIPEGWWEYKHYNGDEDHNYAIDDVVTHWMPLPEPPKGE